MEYVSFFLIPGRNVPSPACNKGWRFSWALFLLFMHLEKHFFLTFLLVARLTSSWIFPF